MVMPHILALKSLRAVFYGVTFFCYFTHPLRHRTYFKGASINYVSRRGEGGLAYVVNLLTEGEGVNIWQNLAYVVYRCPLI